MKLLSCNVRYSRADDGNDSWPLRRDFLVAVIRECNADIIGFQEPTPEQFDYLRSSLEDYEALGILDRAENGDPVVAIFYKRKGFLLESRSAYWLSATPHVSGSKSWDSDCIRLAHWAQFVQRGSGKRFRFVNTHLDHISQTARENQARLINEDAAAYPADYPQFLTGDMNCGGENPVIRSLLKAGWNDANAGPSGPRDRGATFHGFRGRAGEEEKIDWIFNRGASACSDFKILRNSLDGRYPSDHYFVSAEVELL